MPALRVINCFKTRTISSCSGLLRRTNQRSFGTCHGSASSRRAFRNRFGSIPASLAISTALIILRSCITKHSTFQRTVGRLKRSGTDTKPITCQHPCRLRRSDLSRPTRHGVAQTGKPLKVVIIALARKLLTRLNAMVREERNYRSQSKAA